MNLKELESKLKKRKVLSDNSEIHKVRAERDPLYRLLMCSDDIIVMIDTGEEVYLIDKLLQNALNLLDLSYGNEFTKDFLISKVRKKLGNEFADSSKDYVRKLKLFLFLTILATEVPLQTLYINFSYTKEIKHKTQLFINALRDKHLPYMLTELAYNSCPTSGSHVSLIINTFIEVCIDQYLLPQIYQTQNIQTL